MEAKNLRVEGIKDLSENHYLLELENSFASPPRPGQFIHIKIAPFFLRRPFSVAGCSKEKLSILFKIAGKGSEVLSRVKKGDVLSVIGPLGKGFPYKSSWKKAFLVAGGTGIAPLLFLRESLAEKEVDVLFFYGARDKKNLLFEMIPYKAGFVFSTEDGSYGKKGLIYEELIRCLDDDLVPDVIYAGGPSGLLKEVSLVSGEHEIPCFISLENRMACGTGLCYGCVTRIKTDGGWEYKRVCKDGPVFNAARVLWEK